MSNPGALAVMTSLGVDLCSWRTPMWTTARWLPALTHPADRPPLRPSAPSRTTGLGDDSHIRIAILHSRHPWARSLRSYGEEFIPVPPFGAGPFPAGFQRRVGGAG